MYAFECRPCALLWAVMRHALSSPFKLKAYTHTACTHACAMLVCKLHSCENRARVPPG